MSRIHCCGLALTVGVVNVWALFFVLRQVRLDLPCHDVCFDHIPDSGALEALLDVIGTLLPQEKKTPEEQAYRSAFIHNTFAGPSSGGMVGDQTLVKLVAKSGRDWGKASDQIMSELAWCELRL